VPSLRASDSDRENAAERLRQATTEGRLSAEELEERVEALYTSRTYGELDALLADLPVPSAPQPVHVVRIPRWAGAAGAVTLLLAVVGALTSAARHSAAAVGGPWQRDQFRVPGTSGLFAHPHHDYVAATSMIGVFALLLVCVTLVWLLVAARPTSDA
jgi:hypothetical protein